MSALIAHYDRMGTTAERLCRLDVFDRALREALGRWGVGASEAQHHRFRAHFDAVVEANRTMNLTRITEPIEAAIKHYVDSLSLLLWVDEHRIDVETVLDIGTGAGLPAVPLAIMRPQWAVTAIDSTAKKVRFLAKAAETIGLTNLRMEHAHSAHWRPGAIRRAALPTFDVVVSRATARLPMYLEQAAKLAAPGGWIIAYKTADVEPDEAEAAVGLLRRLRVSAEPRYPYNLELEGKRLRRALYVYRKAP